MGTKVQVECCERATRKEPIMWQTPASGRQEYVGFRRTRKVKGFMLFSLWYGVL